MRADGDLVVCAGEQPGAAGPRARRRGHPAPGGVRASAQPRTWTKADEEEWQLFEDLATLEEWSRHTIPVPGELSGEEVARIAQAAVWVGTERIGASLTGPLRFTVGVSWVAGPSWATAWGAWAPRRCRRRTTDLPRRRAAPTS